MNKKHYILILLLSFISLIFDNQLVRGANSTVADTISMNMMSIETIVVTGTRSEKMIKDIPVQTQVITSREIKSSGHSRLDDVLSSQLPGMEFHQAGYGTSMTFQGLDARQILILVDGERLSGSTNGNIDFSKIPIETIERIEVVKGASSVLYGSNAMGATINIITKEPSGGFEGSVYYNFGGYNQLNKDNENGDILNMTAAAYVGYNSGSFSSATDVTYQGVDPYRMVSKIFERRHYKIINGKPVDRVMFVPIDSNGISVSGWHSFNINQKLEYKISESLTAKLRGGYFWKNRYDLADYSLDTNEDAESLNLIENYQGYDITANIEYKINKNNWIDFSFNTSNTSRTQDSFDKQRNNISIARILYQSTSIKNNTLTIGLDYNRETLNLDLSPGGYDDKYSYNSFSLYIQDDAKLSNHIDLLLGLRLDNYGFDSAHDLFDNFFNPEVDSVTSKGISITPQIAIKYSKNQFTARVNYAMGFRTPSLKERYMEYYQPYMQMTIIGNPNLLPETNNYVSISGDYLSDNKKLYVSANIYANFFDNKIDTYHSVETDELIYQNTQNSQLYGFDVSTRVMLLRGWWLNLSYSYSYRNESGPVNSAQYIFASPHTVSLQTNYTFIANNWVFTPNLSVNYYSPKTYEDMMPTIIHNSGVFVPEVIEGIYEGRLEGYALCNLAFTATLNNVWTFAVGANNIFNYTPTIASFNSALTPGITGYFSIRVNF